MQEVTETLVALRAGCEAEGLNREFGHVVCTHGGTHGSTRSTGRTGTVCSK